MSNWSNAGKQTKKSMKERFWEKVNFGFGENACWTWMGFTNWDGYGIFRDGSVNTRMAHRIIWMWTNGEIPKGMLICHHCDNPACVKPNHLFLGTDNDNMQDKIQKGRDHKPIGEENPMSILSEGNVKDIRHLRKTTPMTYKEIGDMFGVDRHVARRADVGLTWSHLK